MVKRALKSDGYRSPLEKYPKYVQAIGMISIENASLESMLGELLGALLGIHPSIGHTLFFTPKASIARLELLENVIDMSIAKDRELSARVRSVLKKTRSVIGKRHEIIHSLWAENEYDGAPVGRISFPKWGGGEVQLAELTDIIRSYRNLVEAVGPLIVEVQSVRGLGYRSLHDLKI